MLTGHWLAIPWVLVLLLIPLLGSACISSSHKIYSSPASPALPWGVSFGSQEQYSFLVSSVSTQICVGVSRSKDSDGFIRVSSGKKRGLVPADSLAEI